MYSARFQPHHFLLKFKWNTCLVACQAKGVSDVGSAAVRVSGMELGGLVGSLIAGRFSDYMINNAGPNEGAVGKRVQASSTLCNLKPSLFT